MSIPAIEVPYLLVLTLLFAAVAGPFKNLEERGKLDTLIVSLIFVPLATQLYQIYIEQNNYLALVSTVITLFSVMVQFYYGLFKPRFYLAYDKGANHGKDIKILSNPRAFNQMMLGLSLVVQLPFFFTPIN